MVFLQFSKKLIIKRRTKLHFIKDSTIQSSSWDVYRWPGRLWKCTYHRFGERCVLPMFQASNREPRRFTRGRWSWKGRFPFSSAVRWWRSLDGRLFSGRAPSWPLFQVDTRASPPISRGWSPLCGGRTPGPLSSIQSRSSRSSRTPSPTRSAMEKKNWFSRIESILEGWFVQMSEWVSCAGHRILFRYSILVD